MACLELVVILIKLILIDFVTVSSTGNATDFGNFNSIKTGSPSGISNQTRGIFTGGEVPGSPKTVVNII